MFLPLHLLWLVLEFYGMGSDLFLLSGAGILGVSVPEEGKSRIVRARDSATYLTLQEEVPR